MLEKPSQVSVLVLELVVFFEPGSAYLQLRREFALALLGFGPDSISEHLSMNFDSIDDALVLLLPELFHQVGSESHVSEHLRHLVHSVVSTLDLQLLKHSLFSFLRDRRLVQKSA